MNQDYVNLDCIFLASGHSKRFGQDKLRYPLDGKNLCEHCFDALPPGLFRRVCVVARSDAVLALAARHGFMPVPNDDETDDTAVTIRRGLDALPPDGDGVMFCVCDEPYLRPGSIARLRAVFMAAPNRIVRLSWHGTEGNPVIFPSSLLLELRALAPGESGRRVIESHRDLVTLVEAETARELCDIDRPDDFNE